MLAILAFASLIASPEPRFEARLDFGIPDSLCASVRIERYHLFVEAGIITDFGSVGIKSAMGIVGPKIWRITPELRAESGYVYKGDVTPVARFVTGNGALDFDVLRNVSYSFTAFSAGLSFEVADWLHVYSRIGWGWLKSEPTDLGSDLRSAIGLDVTSKRASFDYEGLSIRAGIGISWK